MSAPVRVLELRSVSGTGGGPDKTILLGAAMSDPERAAVTVAYLRNEQDPAFSVDDRARQLGVDYVDIRERHLLDLRAWRQLRQLVRDRRIDVVHGHDYKTNLIALWLGVVTPARPMTTAHNWSGRSWKERLVYYPADKRIARFFRAVIAVSAEVRDELRRCGTSADRIVTIPNGIDCRTFRRQPGLAPDVRRSLGLGTDAAVLGAVGRLGPEKRFDLLLAACARLAAAGRRLDVVIVGDGDERSRLEQMAASLGLANRCHLLGQRGDVARLHHAFDVFVQSSDIEGSPNAVLEAMAMETPIVATDAGGTRELVTSGVHGLLVPVRDAHALAGAIAAVLGDRGAAAVRAAAARARVEERLSFEARTRRLEQIYATVCAS